MPQRPLTAEEIERLRDTPFGRMKTILEERQVPAKQLSGFPAHLHRDLHFRLTVERCEFDSADPYLRISESTIGVGFIFDLEGKMTHMVNYK
jgi:hypothetical protein